MADGSRVALYNLSELKNTTDDVLTNYLNGLKFKQSHYYTDIRLATGYAAVVICAVTFAYDYQYGFEDTKYYTAGTVLLYFFLNSFFTYWMYYVEKDVVYTGDYNGRKVTISSYTKKHDPTYRLKVRHHAAGSEGKESEVTAPFTQWFNADGRVVPQPLQQWLATSVPLIGEADPNSAASSAVPSNDDMSISLSAITSSGLFTTATPSKASKKRKG